MTVEQVDRDAAAELIEALVRDHCLVSAAAWVETAKTIRNGAWHPVAQAFARHREQARAEAIEQAQADDGWLPIEQAPRDGTRVLVILRDPLPDDRPDLARWAGVPFVARNRGDSSDWCFAAPVGCGGWPDEWLVGWRPLPRSLSAAQGEG
jgi:hypothetical protein